MTDKKELTDDMIAEILGIDLEWKESEEEKKIRYAEEDDQIFDSIAKHISKVGITGEDLKQLVSGKPVQLTLRDKKNASS